MKNKLGILLCVCVKNILSTKNSLCVSVAFYLYFVTFCLLRDCKFRPFLVSLSVHSTYLAPLQWSIYCFPPHNDLLRVFVKYGS
jgi:hypothetical protein